MTITLLKGPGNDMCINCDTATAEECLKINRNFSGKLTAFHDESV